MTIRRSRLIALFLALCLGISMIPGGLFATTAGAETYGMVIDGDVRLRKEASTRSDYWFVLPEGWVCTIRSETNAGGQHWYRVIAPHPEAADPTTARTYWGYIPASNFRSLTDAETTEYLTTKKVSSGSSSTTSTVTAAPASSSSGSTTAASGTTGSITNGGTNFREKADKSSKSMMKLDRGTVVTITSIPDKIGGDYWYGVSYDGKNGYVNSEFIRLLSGSNAASVTISPVATATPIPGTAGYNAVKLILSSCHLRTAPNGSYERDQDWEGTGSILPLAGNSASAGGHVWYPVSKDGKVYYVRADCVELINSSSVPASTTATPTPASGSTPTPAPAVSAKGQVTTTKGGCNLRSTPAGTVIKTVGKGRTFSYLSTPTKKGGYTWYYVDVDGTRGYLRNDVVKVSSGSSESSGTVPAVTADPNATGYVKTIASDVNLRTKAGYSTMIGRVAKNVVMPYYGKPTTVNGVTWYYVNHPTLGYGYIHGSYVSVVNADGSATPTPAPTEAPTGAVVTGSSSGSQTEASYPTLKVGSTGTAVRNLVQALKNAGYYNGSVTNKYTDAVSKAVRAYQRANGLSVDGIAGEATQHKLYGTVPVGASDSSNLSMTLYPAEKIDWWTGGINSLWSKGATYRVYDVKTGIVWSARRWSGGYHVDAEPATAADTARLCKCYGVDAASEIASKNLYQRRPLLVTIENRTFACSLYGIPHDAKDQTIKTNNFNGVLCIHFTNSWTHGSKKVDSLHVEAIQYAYEHAPNGNK